MHVPERVDRPLERDHGRVVRQIATHVPANDPARKQIRHQEQIHERVRQSEIGDIADDDLAGRRHRHRFQAIRGHGIPVVRLRGARVPRLPLDQTSRRAQQGKEAIAPDVPPRRRQLRLQRPRAHPRLLDPQGIHRLQHYGRRAGRGAAAGAAFVVRVAAAPERAADARDVVAGASASGVMPKFF